jgi:hypothetical protein
MMGKFFWKLWSPIRLLTMNAYQRNTDPEPEEFASKEIALFDGGEELLDRIKKVARQIEERVRQVTGNVLPGTETPSAR